MANMEQVTVDKSYFDALLRRADFHTASQILGRPDPANVSISRVEYDSLLRVSREYELLKNALFQGGLTAETLALLISGANAQQQPQQTPVDSWADDFNDHPSTINFPKNFTNGSSKYNDMPWKPTANTSHFKGAFNSGTRNGHSANLRVPSTARHTSNGYMPSSVPEDGGFDEGISSIGDGNTEVGLGAQRADSAMRTLYFCGLHPDTTYRDLLSVLKGGKILSINLQSNRSATVTFHDGAVDFLAWVKRNDLYLNSKRVEVRWAERQFRLNNHIHNKVLNGATRNILIRNAAARDFTAEQIRDDMEHIHNLIIIDVTFRNGHAYVSTNSVHNALFARTCMMSRTTYRGCKVEFYHDECDIPLPVRAQAPRAVPQEPVKKQMPLANRFDMLETDSGASSTDIENRDPNGTAADSDDDTIDIKPRRHGVRLDFLDSESEA